MKPSMGTCTHPPWFVRSLVREGVSCSECVSVPFPPRADMGFPCPHLPTCPPTMHPPYPVLVQVTVNRIRDVRTNSNVCVSVRVCPAGKSQVVIPASDGSAPVAPCPQSLPYPATPVTLQSANPATFPLHPGPRPPKTRDSINKMAICPRDRSQLKFDELFHRFSRPATVQTCCDLGCHSFLQSLHPVASVRPFYLVSHHTHAPSTQPSRP